ncbi:MAG TPA: glycosyltransferase family 4 protein [Steroidobacteraceae bacterium]|jgi:glycosyltransferase involved in cell wall biosynthesis|nr:glycosyltransferase family 4 protein [Steroidobacteraceae bacterium]
MLSEASHVVQISFFVDPQRREPSRLLRDWPTLVDVAEAAQRGGVRVSVVQACSHTERVTRNGVDYHFFAADLAAQAVASTKGLGTLIHTLQADVFHVHGLSFPADVGVLADIAPDTPLLLQDHADRPPRIWRRRAWRRAFALASGVAFCATEQSEAWTAAGLIGAGTEIYQIPESSSRFKPGQQAEARARTPLKGDPCLLWVGHLNANKDPLTVLDGVSEAVGELPGLQLWCCFGSAPLRAQITRRIERDPRLTGRVHLLGAVPHAEIEMFMRAADFFVQGSHREGSGYALLEALACGLPPVVTDIPSFRSLTGEGAVGRLWPCGNAGALSEALVSIATQPRAPLRTQVRAHFDRNLSFDALGRTLAETYQRLRNHKPGLVRTDRLRRAGARPTPI